MPGFYTDENREDIVSLLPNSWRDTFRAVWNLHTVSPVEDWVEASSGILAITLRKHDVNRENVAVLRFAARKVVLNADKFNTTRHALICSHLLEAAACYNSDERRSLLEVAHIYLHFWDRTRNLKG